MKEERELKGSELSPAVQKDALARFIHRFTRDHIPAWSKQPRPDGSAYPVQFASDRDWLEHTLFSVNKDGSLDKRREYCFSMPTWPDNPEMRDKAVRS